MLKSLVTLFLTFSIFSFAQEPSLGTINRYSNSLSGVNPNQISGNFNFDNVKINPNSNKNHISCFLFDNWMRKAELTDFLDKKLTVYNLNFDVYNQKFVSLVTQDSLMVHNNLSEVLIDKQRYVNFEGDFYQVLFDSPKFKLLKAFNGKLKPAVYNKMTNQLLKAEKYIKFNRYFFFNGLDYQPVKLKRKSLLKKLEKDKQSIVRRYAKKQNLSFKKEKDVVLILSYYNSLLQ